MCGQCGVTRGQAAKLSLLTTPTYALLCLMNSPAELHLDNFAVVSCRAAVLTGKDVDTFTAMRTLTYATLSFLNARLIGFTCRRPLLLVLTDQDDAGGIGIAKTFHPQKHKWQA